MSTMNKKSYKNCIHGVWKDSQEKHTVTNPYNGKTVSMVSIATKEDILEAIESAESCKTTFRNTSRFLRSQLLLKMVEILKVRKDDIIFSIIEEAGKPITLAEGEYQRCINTFTIASQEVNQFCGEVYPMDLDPIGRGFYTGVTEFFPKGSIYGITPFNFPINLVAHKVAPALAVGAPILIKPAPQAPGAAFLLAEIFLEAVSLVNNLYGSHSDKIPNSALQVFFTTNELASIPLQDERISIISFTGSPQVGWKLQQLANKKKVILELGGNAGVILAEDGDPKLCASRSAFGACSYSGQSCISVQRIYAVEAQYDTFKRLLIEEFQKQKHGDPNLKETIVGPIIDKRSKERIQSWLEEAIQSGATLLTGGNWNGPQGNILEPTLLENVPYSCKLFMEEAFAPIAILEKVKNFEEGIEKINQSKYGLHAGIFTNQLENIQKAFKDLEVGGIIVNEVPTFRADHMPYGGVKESGIGREGVKYTMEEYCERKTIVIKK